MLSSIHPLGERGRNNRWWITTAAFTVGSTGAGAIVGALLGAGGSLSVSALSADGRLAVTGLAVVTAGVLDIFRVSPPGPERQVNESWIGHYRGWVYGGGFGVELGLGVMTFVVTWGVYATFIAEFLTGSLAAGALVGAVFGFGRSIALLAAGVIDRPSRLTRFHERMAVMGRPVRQVAAFGTTSLGALAGLVLLT